MILLLAAMVFVVAPPLHAGNVAGVVQYKGKVPNLRPIAMDADPACHAKHDTPVQSEMLVIGEGNELANIFVSVKSGLPAGKKYPMPAKPAVLDQHGCMYIPHVLGMRAGQPLKILNSDGIMHNIHALPKDNKEFNMAMPPTVTEAQKGFDKPETSIEIKCDVHPWMKAYVHVVEHPFFDVTDKRGRFVIRDLPPGDYEISAWHEHPKLSTEPIKVTIDADTTTKTLEFVFQGPE
jgi:plastocyanin